MSDCGKCGNVKVGECPGCSQLPWWSVKTDVDGKCLVCHEKLWPDGGRPLSEEEKEKMKHSER